MTEPMFTPPRSGWRLYWLALILIAFGVPEAYAIARHRPEDTFSAAAQAWLGTFRKGARFRWARVAAFVLFSLALVIHWAQGMPAWPGLILPAVPLTVFVLLSQFVWEEK